MFDELVQKLDVAVRNLRGVGKITEKALSESLRDIRRILLEADVNYKVVKTFISRVEEKALGESVVKSVTPGQQVVKIVHDELVELLGHANEPLHFGNMPPSIVMIVGLQGSGKTTFSGKLAVHLRQRGRNPMLVAADIYRPAAVDQLITLGKSVDIPVFHREKTAPLDMVNQAVAEARKAGIDTLILDTAGRLHIDEEMMGELKVIKEKVKPHEILFVADGMTGQDAVRSASAFQNELDYHGIVLTKLDGDARGGAALSIRHVTGKPIKFVSSGEKLDALEAFHPDRMASRILGMGDVVSLVEKAQQAVDQDEAERLSKKLRKQSFTLEDFYSQLQQVKKMGPLSQVMGMIPGAQKMKGLEVDDDAMKYVEAIINSMTVEERRRPGIINGSRRKRIALGSGTSVQEVNRLLKQFQSMQKMMKQMSRLGGRGRMPQGMPIGM